MKRPVLVILAAGMGSRYGGLKQIDRLGPHGEIIIDYSLYDAARAGFEKAVFLIAPGMHETFEEVIGRRAAKKLEVAYAEQSLEKYVPADAAVCPGRVKPWGTGHAILCAGEAVDGPFCVINSDDYYGPTAFELMYSRLCSLDESAAVAPFSMVAYHVGNTVTDKGSVARGMCRVEDGRLTGIRECTCVVKTPSGPAYSDDGGLTLTHLDYDSPVSMNFWGFTPRIFGELENRFAQFVRERGMEEKSEFFIPSVVEELRLAGLCTVEVMSSPDRWYGVTYREDKPDVAAALKKMAEEGLYPADLWA